MIREVNITLDLYKQNYSSVKLKQSDTTKLIFNIFTNGVTANLSSHSFILNFLKADKTVAIQNTNFDTSNIASGIVKVTLIDDCVRVAGESKIELQIKKDGNLISNFNIDVFVESALLDYTTSQNKNTVLDELNDAIDEGISTKAELDNWILTHGDISRLDDRVDVVESSLADNTSKVNILVKMKANPFFYGAKGDGVTDDTLAIINAINSMTNGGELDLPPNDFLVKGTGSNIFLLDRPVKIKGKGYTSQLVVEETTPITCDIIKISPNVSAGKTLYGLEDFRIKAKSGTPGRHGIHLDVTNTGQYLSKFNMAGVSVNALGGKSVKLTNPTNSDGFFCSTFQDNEFWSGTEFERIGDSVNFLRNIVTGNNIGFDISTVLGARECVIENNNITANGALKLRSGSLLKFLRNQVEQTIQYAGIDNAMIVIGSEAVCSLIEIEGNNLNSHNNINNILKIDKSVFTTIDKNYLIKGVEEAINITANANRTFIGRRNFYEYNGTEISPSILDNGNGTAGVEKIATLQNAWVEYDPTNYGNAGYWKDYEGVVHLQGVIKSGVTTNGTTLFTLPVNFRPSKVRMFKVTSRDGSGVVQAEIIITPTGNVYIQTGGNVYLNLNDISFKAG